MAEPAGLRYGSEMSLLTGRTMGWISATDANRNFSKLRRQVENGDRVTITKEGRPVAVLTPGGERDTPGREAARQRMLTLLRQGLPIGFAGGLDREDLHRR